MKNSVLRNGIPVRIRGRWFVKVYAEQTCEDIVIITQYQVLGIES